MECTPSSSAVSKYKHPPKTFSLIPCCISSPTTKPCLFPLCAAKKFLTRSKDYAAIFHNHVQNISETLYNLWPETKRSSLRKNFSTVIKMLIQLTLFQGTRELPCAAQSSLERPSSGDFFSTVSTPLGSSCKNQIDLSIWILLPLLQEAQDFSH